MKLESLTPGMTVWDVARRKMGNTTRSTVSVWGVAIVSIDLASRTIIASWNGNRERVFSEREAKRWRQNKPVLVNAGILECRRLATREEIKAMKENNL